MYGFEFSLISLFFSLADQVIILKVLTGISYEKLNILHRAASYTLLILIWVHFWGRVSTISPFWSIELTSNTTRLIIFRQVLCN